MKYVADTNVVSELTKGVPNAAVMRWMAEHDQDLHLTSITVEEMCFGELMLPKGKRRSKLREIIDELVAGFASKIWVFDTPAAERCAALHRYAVASGRTPSIEDLMIAAICQEHGAALVTRNVKDFDYLGIEYVNPFE